MSPLMRSGLYLMKITDLIGYKIIFLTKEMIQEICSHEVTR